MAEGRHASAEVAARWGSSEWEREARRETRRNAWWILRFAAMWVVGGLVVEFLIAWAIVGMS